MADIHGFELTELDIKCIQLTHSLEHIRNCQDHLPVLRIHGLRRLAKIANDLADELIEEVETPVSGERA